VDEIENQHQKGKKYLIDNNLLYREEKNESTPATAEEQKAEALKKLKEAKMVKQTKHEKKVFDDLSSNRSKYGEHLDIDTLTKEFRDDPLMDLSI
jgi:hypothetical protein